MYLIRTWEADIPARVNREKSWKKEKAKHFPKKKATRIRRHQAGKLKRVPVWGISLALKCKTNIPWQL